MPTWGATEPGHAAMSTWTPTGWDVLLGAGWPSAWWGEEGGVHWHLEVQAREVRPAYQQVLRGGWAATADGDAPVAGKGEGKGGVWNALMWALQVITAQTTPVPRALGTSLVPTKVDALIAKFKAKPTPPTISTNADGTMVIPASAFTSKNKSAAISTMQSAGPGEQIIHNGCASSVGPPCAEPLSSSFEYEITVTAAGTYYLTAVRDSSPVLARALSPLRSAHLR
jgi:hypothetical protein